MKEAEDACNLVGCTTRLGDRLLCGTLLIRRREAPGLTQPCLALEEFQVQWESQVESCPARPQDPSRMLPRAKL